MKSSRSTWLSFPAVLVLGGALLGCGSAVELRPELQAHLDKYEDLIDTYESKFAAVRGDPPKFGDVADAYSIEVKAWMSQWKSLAPNLSDEEGKAIQAAINRLNRRAERMLRSM